MLRLKLDEFADRVLAKLPQRARARCICEWDSKRRAIFNGVVPGKWVETHNSDLLDLLEPVVTWSTLEPLIHDFTEYIESQLAFFDSEKCLEILRIMDIKPTESTALEEEREMLGGYLQILRDLAGHDDQADENTADVKHSVDRRGRPLITRSRDGDSDYDGRGHRKTSFVDEDSGSVSDLPEENPTHEFFHDDRGHQNTPFIDEGSGSVSGFSEEVFAHKISHDNRAITPVQYPNATDGANACRRRRHQYAHQGIAHSEDKDQGDSASEHERDRLRQRLYSDVRPRAIPPQRHRYRAERPRDIRYEQRPHGSNHLRTPRFDRREHRAVNHQHEPEDDIDEDRTICQQSGTLAAATAKRIISEQPSNQGFDKGKPLDRYQRPVQSGRPKPVYSPFDYSSDPDDEPVAARNGVKKKKILASPDNFGSYPATPTYCDPRKHEATMCEFARIRHSCQHAFIGASAVIVACDEAIPGAHVPFIQNCSPSWEAEDRDGNMRGNEHKGVYVLELCTVCKRFKGMWTAFWVIVVAAHPQRDELKKFMAEREAIFANENSVGGWIDAHKEFFERIQREFPWPGGLFEDMLRRFMPGLIAGRHAAAAAPLGPALGAIHDSATRARGGSVAESCVTRSGDETGDTNGESAASTPKARGKKPGYIIEDSTDDGTQTDDSRMDVDEPEPAPPVKPHRNTRKPKSRSKGH
ncbi:Uu.00g141310.m01.CDS01 [Anthostomella pinea]|uniref:Uu.00g141310.m01.CDS01 n=1 Tax=Anthostomella pinea TaxID=933095 RepID=A0AAI8VQB5_9PEZI|nr:Uu.00g141310.m01.CDS01 [Anthostomella pinea]